MRVMAQSRKHGSQAALHSAIGSSTRRRMTVSFGHCVPVLFLFCKSARKFPILATIALIGASSGASAANVFDQFDAKQLAFAGPAKLVITWYQSNLTLIDYPSQARCEQARNFVLSEVDRRSHDAQAALPAGSVTVGVTPNGAFCIPG